MKHQTHPPLAEASTKDVRPGKRALLYEGRVKNLYHSDKPEMIIQEFKSNGIIEGRKRTAAQQLAALKNEISSYLFEYLEGFHLPTHFVSKISETEMMVKRLAMIPLVVKIYNMGGGSLTKRLGLKEWEPLEFPIIEHYYRSDDTSISWVNEYHAYALGLTTPEEFKQINRLASKINAVLRGLCDRRQLMLADFQLEFGRCEGQIVVGDELSPSTCHFVDTTEENKNDRDRFIAEREGAEEMFAVLRDRLALRV